MSVLPSFLKTVSEAAQGSTASSETASIPKEYGVDFATGQLTGKIVEGVEAIRVWVWNCLHTQRFRYPVYSWDYGADLEQYTGEALPDEYLEEDMRDEVEEALCVNPYITGISGWTFTRTGSGARIEFTVQTKFGNVQEVQDVIL